MSHEKACSVVHKFLLNLKSFPHLNLFPKILPAFLYKIPSRNKSNIYASVVYLFLCIRSQLCAFIPGERERFLFNAILCIIIFFLLPLPHIKIAESSFISSNHFFCASTASCEACFFAFLLRSFVSVFASTKNR